MGGEEWRPIPCFPVYEASAQGRIRSVDRVDARGQARAGKLKGFATQKSGHRRVGLYVDGRRVDEFVHTLVLLAFVGPRPHGHFGCHWNDDPSDNRLENLRWATPSENIRDQVRNGVHGEANRTHCPKGHPYSASNTYMRPSGGRACRTCRRAHKAAFNSKARAEEERV